MPNENNTLNEIGTNKAQQIFNDIYDSNSAPSLPDIINKITENNIILDNEKARIFRILIIKNKSITQDELIEGMKEIDIKDDFEKSKIIETFILRNPELIKTQENVIDIINALEIKNEFAKFKIIQAFVFNNDSNVVGIIKDAEIENDDIKSTIVQVFICNKKPSEVHHQNIAEIIEELGIKDQNNKSNIVKYIFLQTWFSRNEGFEDKDLRDNIIINKEFVPNIYFAPNLHFDKKEYFALNENGDHVLNENATAENFIKIIEDFGLQHPTIFVVGLYQFTFGANKKVDVGDIVKIAQKLYPSEAVQCEFIKNIIIELGSINKENVFHLKPLIEKLQDNALALDLIETLCEKEILIEEKDILSLVRNRSKKQYDFLSAIVEGVTINECFNDEGLELLKETFGDDLTVDGTPITVSDLISYFDIKNQNSVLSSILKPEFKKQLRDNFSPSSEIFLYKSRELEKLNQLLSEEGVDFDVKTYFIENKELCDFLRKKVGNISEIDPETTYQINFKKFSSSEEGQKIEQEQQEINSLFNQILKDSDPDPIMVKDFFTKLLTEFEFPPNEQNKLKFFFVNNKKEIAHCFCGDEKSSEDFKYSLMTIKDGCFANMGMQFRKALYATIIEDEEVQIFYKFADYKIFSAIINQSGEDVIGRVQDPFDNKEINSCYLSPMLLISKLAEEESLVPIKSWEIIKNNMGRAFVGQLSQSESLNFEDSWAIIRNNFGDEMASELLEKLMEEIKEPEKIDQKSKEIASYFIVKMIVGDDKMQDLESKNPQLKTLRNLIYDRGSKLSPQTSANDNEEDFLISPSQEIMRRDSLDQRGFSQEFSSIDLRESSPQASPREATCLPAFSCFRLFGLRGRW
jgi:hypothetical protein